MSLGRAQKVAAIAAAMSAFAASAQSVDPNGLGRGAGVALPDAAGTGRFELSSADALDRWRLSAGASRDPAGFVMPAAFPRFDWAAAAAGDLARADLAFDWQRRIAGGAFGASAFASGARGDFADAPLDAIGAAPGVRLFQQRSRESTFGGALSWNAASRLFGIFGTHGAQLRLRSSGHDWQSGASDERGALQATRRDQLDENSATVDFGTDIRLPLGVRASAGVRYDSYRAAVRSDTSTSAGSVAANLASPRLRLGLPVGRSEAFVAMTRGLASDDTRSMTLVDPRTKAPVARLDPVAGVENFEVGFRGHWLPGADTSVSMFRLKSSDEIFLSGENTITAFSRPTVRHGVQAAARYEPFRWLTVDLQAAALKSRFGDGANEDLPGAAQRIASAAATVRGPHGWGGSLLLNSLGRQGESLAAMGASTFVSAQLTRKLSKDTRVSLDLFNVFGRPLRDIDYLSTTRLWTQSPAGDAGLPGPAEPRGVRVQFRVRF